MPTHPNIRLMMYSTAIMSFDSLAVRPHCSSPYAPAVVKSTGDIFPDEGGRLTEVVCINPPPPELDPNSATCAMAV